MAGRHSASSDRPRSRAVPVLGVLVAAAVLGVGGFTVVGNAGTKPAVAECGGRVTVESTPGQGATFSIHLPVAGGTP